MRSPQADSRARARDERVAAGDERIGWGGCGGNWCPGVVRSYSRTLYRPIRANRLGRVWRSGVRMSRSRDRHSRSIGVCERIGWGGRGEVVSRGRDVVSVPTVCPYVASSSIHRPRDVDVGVRCRGSDLQARISVRTDHKSEDVICVSGSPTSSAVAPAIGRTLVVLIGFLGGLGYVLLRVRSGGSVSERLDRIERKVGRLEAQLEHLQEDD